MSQQARRIPGSDFLLSGTAAVLAITCTNPIDVVKTRLQLQGEPGYRGARYRGVWHAMRTIGAAEGLGLQGLQRGLPPACALQFSNVAMRFGGYAWLTAAFQIDPVAGASGVLGALALGSASGFMAACVSNPFFLLKTRAQAASSGGGGGGGLGLLKVLREEGVRRGLFRGFGAFAPRVAAATAVQLPTYRLAKSTLMTRAGMGDDLVTHFCASWATGVAVVAAMQPFDFAAARFMNQGKAAAAVNGAEGAGAGTAAAAAAAGTAAAAGAGVGAGAGTGVVLYSSPLDVVAKTVRVEGVRGLYAGALANYLRFGPYCCLVFLFLEQLKRGEAFAFRRFGGAEQ